MKSKSIIIVISSFPRISETFIVSNVVEAIEKGFDVRIITKDKRSEKFSSQEFLLHKYKLLEKTISSRIPIKIYKRILFSFFCLLHPLVLVYFIKYSWHYKKIELNILFKLHYYRPFRKATIFHVHFATNAEEIPELKQIGFIKSKLLVTFHGYDAFFRTNNQQEILMNKYSLLFQMADRLTVNSPFLKSGVLALGCPECKLSVVHVGINLNYFKPKNYPKKINLNFLFKMISVGRLVELKGHEFGIRAAKKLLDSGFSISYSIIGEGVLLEKLGLLIKELGIQDAVVLIGKSSQEQIREAFMEAHLFLMTSVKDITGREETQGVVTAEAQAMGLPVVGFASGGVSSTVSKDTGILVYEKETTAMAAAVALIIQNPDTYQAMSLAARKWVKQNFNLDTMIDNYYKDLI